jgi:cellulose synthase/poly-beta-1,6-N-acetylglucosamine synthase-like glycosyltransferase
MTAFVLLALAAFLIFYVLIGYPLLLAYGRFRHAPPIKKSFEFEPTVTVLLAVYNGGAFLRAKLDSLLALDYPKRKMDILVVSDGSTDDTDAIATSFADRGVRLLRAPKGGKAAALNFGLPNATGEIIFFTDVRQILGKQALRHLAANFADPTVGAVTGELRMLNPAGGEQADMDLYWRYELWARRQHSQIDSLFNTTGCIYTQRRSLVESIPSDTLTDDAVIPLHAYFSGYRVLFDPEAIAYDHPVVAGGEFRRRMRTLAGMWQVYARLPKLFLPVHRMWFHFMPHKFGRLALPWLILLAVGATVALPPSAFRSFLLIDEAALALLAIFDWIVPPKLFLKRLTSPARTFLVMNAAALGAMAVFFVSPNRLWSRTSVDVRSHQIEKG